MWELILDKTFLGASATILSFVGYVPYFYGIYKKTVKPHVFTWFAGGTFATVIFLAQLSDGAGAGAWPTAAAALLSIAIAIAAIFNGSKDITKKDYLALAIVIAIIPLWHFTTTPLYAVILVTLAFGIGFYPTIRKSFNAPWEESALTYSIQGFKHIFSVMALSNFSFITALYPATWILINFGFTAMLLYRRKIISNE